MKGARFLPEAETEFLHELSYYEELRPGLGRQFLESLQLAAGRAQARPLTGKPGPFGTRALLLKGFPFSLVYQDLPSEILVVALAAHRRKAGYWQQRVPG